MTDQQNGFNNQAHGEQPQQPAAAPAYDQHTAGPQKTNTLAIVGLVLAFLAAPIGAIISFVALNQIKKTNEGGRGIALAGAILGTIATVLAVITIIASLVIAGAALNNAKNSDFSSSSSSSSSSSGSSSDSSDQSDSSDVDQAVCDAFTQITEANEPADVVSALEQLATQYSDDPAKLTVVNDFKAAIESLDTAKMSTSATAFDTVLRDDQYACLSR